MQQLQLSCEEATDSIICDQDNGLVWTESASFGARFQLEAPETLDTLIVVNGAGRQGHKISGINIQIKSEIRQNLAEVKVKEEFDYVAVATGTRGFLIRIAKSNVTTFVVIDKFMQATRI